MFCALLKSRYQVSVYRTNGPLVTRFQSIFSMIVWNTIDDRYSNVVLYIEMKPHFLIFSSPEPKAHR